MSTKKTHLMKVFSLLMLLTLILTTVGVFGSDSVVAETQRTEIQPWESSELIEVKFVEGSTFRLRDGALKAQNAGDLIEVNAVFSTFGVTQIERLFSQPEAEITAEKAELQPELAQPLPDLNLWFRVGVPEGTDPGLLIDALNALPEVQTAYAAPLPAPPTSINLSSALDETNPPPFAPNYESNQGYLDPAPNGIDAEYAWGISGGRGNLVKIVDVEYSLNQSHLDLPTIALIHGAMYHAYGDDHGTAVAGELVAKKDGIGVSGIAYQATETFSSPCSDASCSAYNPADAINAARTNSVSGDVILLEQQYPACGTSNYGPLEWIQSVYDATLVATTAGRNVVAAAGNGGLDLDAVGCLDKFNRSVRDSGAIIVGAGAAPTGTQTARSRLSFSSYGSRVDLQGWGQNVYTTGYGGLYTNGTNENEDYTATFSGTSSASPIVTGAVAILSSVAEQNGSPLTPAQVRSTLVSTGTPQQAHTGYPVSQHIGPLPDLKSALSVILTPSPTPIEPAGSYWTRNLTYKWTKITSATEYQYRVWDGGTKVWDKTVYTGACGATFCTHTPSIQLIDSAYKWQVRVKVGGTWSAWSALKWFTIKAGFDSPFSRGAPGWAPPYGAWTWDVKYGNYRTSGIYNTYSSSRYDQVYSIYTYEVKLRRQGTDMNGSYGIHFNGNPWPLTSSKMWNKGYLFLLSRRGDWGLWRTDGGVFTNLTPWTVDPVVKTGWYNTLKVTYNKSNGFTQLFINGTLVDTWWLNVHKWGNVGLSFYKGTTGWEQLLVDYAKLTISAPTASPEAGAPIIDDATIPPSGTESTIYPDNR